MSENRFYYSPLSRGLRLCTSDECRPYQTLKMRVLGVDRCKMHYGKVDQT